MSRVLVVEDEPAIAELVAINLRHAGHEALMACSAEEAAAVAERSPPDVAVVDWMLPPGESGLQLVQRWRGMPRTRDLPVIMLTARTGEADRVSGLDAGADDYLVKPFSINELLARIRAVLRRRSPEALETPLEFAGLRLDPASRRVNVGARELRLGPTEFKLLHFFMSHPDRVHTRRQVLDRVWGAQAFIEERTVDVHVKRLRAALAPAGFSPLIETVRGAGYRMAKGTGQAA